jgi:hypothetical protein
MKRIVVSLLVLFATFSAFAQPLTRRAMDVNTVSDARLQAEKNFFLPRYADTTAANLSKGIDSCGASIFTYDNNTQWLRACNPKRWVKAAGSLVADNTATVNLSGDGSTATPLTADVNLSTTGQNAIVALADGLYVPNSVRNGLVWGGTVTWISGYTYNVAEAYYYINGAPFHSPTTTITLDPSDNDSSRIDLIVVNNQNLVAVVKGDLSTSPLEPTIDPSSQLRLSIVLVQAGTTEPTNNGTGLRRECIYQENTEWTTASSSARINANSTNAPCVGSKDVEGTGVLNGDYVRFTRPSGNITILDSFQVITFQLKSKGDWTKNRKLILRWQSSGVNVGGVVNLSGSSYGWSSNLTGVCQTISIPLVDFGLPAGASVNQLLITASMPNGSIGFYLDQMCLQNQEQPSYATPITLQNGLNLDASTNIGELGGTLLHNTTNNTNYYVHTLYGNPVYDYPYQFQQGQNFGNGTGVTSFLSKGGVYPTSPDYNNTVRLGVNYTSDMYNNSPATEGYFGDRIGYMLNTNLRGHGSYGMYQDDYKAKNVGIFFHTRDNIYRDGVTIFAADSSNVAGDYSGAALKTHKAAIFKTTGALQLPKYGVGTFTGTTAYTLGVDASGNIIETTGGGLTAITADNGLTANTTSNVRLGGTLLQNVTINTAGFQTNWSGANSSALFGINNTGTGSGFTVTAASGVGATIQSNGTTAGLFTGTLAAQLNAFNSASLNAVIPVINLSRTAGSNIPSDGIGGSIDLYANVNDAGVTRSRLANQIVYKWTDAAHATRTSQYEIWGTNNATTARKLAIAGNGKLTLDGYGSGTQTGTAVYGLSVDASGNVIERTLGITGITADNGLTASTSTNVQLGGTLLANTTIATTAAFVLNVSGAVPSATSAGTFQVTNTSSTGTAIVGTANSSSTTAIQGNATVGIGVGGTGSTGVQGNSTSGIGLNGTATSGTGVTASATTGVPAQLTANASTSNTVVDVLRVERNYSGGAGASGIGGAISFRNETDANFNTQISNRIISKWIDATLASRTSAITFEGVNAATTVDIMTLDSRGYVKLNGITATAASALTASAGMVVFVNTTDATFTSAGFWGYDGTAWSKF